MPYPLPLTRTEAYLAYKAGVVQLTDLKPSLAKPRIGIDDWLAYWTGLKNDYPKNPDGTPKMLQEEEKYIAYLSGVTNTYPEKCLRRVGAYLRYLISARWGRPDHPLNREELYLSLIKTQFIPSGDPSSDITIDGTAKAPFVDIKMYGDTFQQSYTGKNLLKLNDATITLGGVPITTTNGTVNLNGTATSSAQGYYVTIGMTASEPMVFSPNRSGTTSGLDIKLQYKRGETVYYPSVGNYLSLQAGDIIQQMYLIISNGSVLDGSFSPMLEVGSTATSFEPFVGGQPSPSPDYPQPIQTVTGRQVVNVTGKNLLNTFRFQNYSLNGVVLSIGADGSITLNGTSTTSGNIRADVTDIFKNRVGEQLTYSIETSGTGIFSNFGLKTPNATISGNVTPTEPTRTVTLGESSTGNYIADVYFNGGKTFDNFVIKIQIEAGSTATAYEPYSSASYPISLGSLELCKLGAYQDYIWKDGEDWKVHKAVEKLRLVSSQGWAKSSTMTTLDRYFIRDYFPSGTIPSDLSAVVVQSNYFTAISQSASDSGAYGICQLNGRGIMINTALGAFSSNDDFKNWLDSNSVNAYYALSTPTDTTITDQTLIAQLDSLVNGGAEDGTTYIKVNATDPNLPGLLYVEAPKYE